MFGISATLNINESSNQSFSYLLYQNRQNNNNKTPKKSNAFNTGIINIQRETNNNFMSQMNRIA